MRALIVAVCVSAVAIAQARTGTSSAGLSYDTVGTGDPVVLIHAFSVDRRMWDAQVPALQNRFTVIRYDLRGHGKSDAPSMHPQSTKTTKTTKPRNESHMYSRGFVSSSKRRTVPLRSDEAGATFLKSFSNSRQRDAAVEALRAFGEHRAVRVLEVDPREPVLRLEHVQPGAALASIASEDEAMHVVARLFGPRWPAVPATSVATALTDFVSALESSDLRRAKAILSELLDDDGPPALLHGDLHYDNILTSDRAGHLLIDPKGFAGDPAFDIGYLISRPLPVARDQLPLARALDRRLAFLPEAIGLDRQRVAAFAYVTAALSVAWAREDHDPNVIRFVEAMELLEV